MTHLRVAALSGGQHVPSARFRVTQYRQALHERGIQLDHFPSRVGSYPPRRRVLRLPWLVATVADRLPDVLRTRRYDVTLLQRELVSTLATLEGLTRRPRVLDVDDALWTLRGGHFARRIAERCDAVICGNDYLADYFGRHCRSIAVIPTAVDVERYRPAPVRSAEQVIGWSGTSAGLPYLYRIEGALRRVLERRPRARLRVMADRSPQFETIAPDRVEFVRWSPETEVAALQGMAVGLMPLTDTPWERGKCSYKMLLYMACGVPAVVSPVGMNVDVLGRGPVGHAARTDDEWVEAMLGLLDDPATAAAIGAEGRRVAEADFSVDRASDLLAAELRRVA